MTANICNGYAKVFALLLGLCCVVFYGCGQADERQASASSSVGAVNRTPVVRTLAGQPEGDHDDDEQESKTIGTNPAGDSDSDSDNDAVDGAHTGYRDSDDRAWLAYGRPADKADFRAISTVVASYLRAGAQDDGALACSLQLAAIANSMVEDHGQGAGPSYSRGRTCAVVMSKVFSHFRAQTEATYQITGIRTDHDDARVFLGSTTVPAGYIRLALGGRVWKVVSLLPAPLP